MRDRSHIDETLRLATAEPSAQVSGEEQRDAECNTHTRCCCGMRSVFGRVEAAEQHGSIFTVTLM